MYKPYSDSTLMSMTKKELIEQLRVAEHNSFVTKEAINQQAENMLNNFKLIKYGEWIGKPIAGYGTVKCSVCKTTFNNNNGKWRYCPICGTQMYKEE